MVIDGKQDAAGSAEETDAHVQHSNDGGRRSRVNAWISWSIAVALATFHWFTAVSSSLHNATTFDEVAHIAGGLGPITLNDYRFDVLFFLLFPLLPPPISRVDAQPQSRCISACFPC
jgi:hypothetical protein